MTNQTVRNRMSRAESLGWGLIYGALAALPLLGLVLFLQITRPAQVHSEGFVSTELAGFEEGDASAPVSPLLNNAVARLKGVSAEVGQTGSAASEAHLLSASDAALAFGRTPRAGLKVGFKTEIVTKDHRRIAIRILQRERITDQAIPDNARLMNIMPASTANVVSFVWGSWLYAAEIEDKGIEPDVAVQEVL